LALRERNRLVEWWLNLIVALCNLGLGGLALIFPLLAPWLHHPGGEASYLSALVGIQGLIQGCLAIGMSLDLHHEVRIRGLFMFFALFSMAAGILILANPYTDALAQQSLLWIYGLACGLSLLPAAFKLRLYR